MTPKEKLLNSASLIRETRSPKEAVELLRSGWVAIDGKKDGGYTMYFIPLKDYIAPESSKEEAEKRSRERFFEELVWSALLSAATSIIVTTLIVCLI